MTPTPEEALPASSPDVILSFDAQERTGIPLDLAGWLMTQLGDAFPHCTVADSKGSVMAVRISAEDLRRWRLDRDLELNRGDDL